MADVGELVVRIRADATQLEQQMKRAQGVVRQSSGGMQSSLGGLTAAFRGLVPAISVAALVGFGKNAVEAAGRMNDLAQRIGFAASTLSALEGGLAANGASLEEFAASVNLMNANLGQAVSGNQQMIEAFDRLGLSVAKLKALSPEEQFYAITRALAQVGTQYEQTELARAIFGRGAAALIPIIKETNGQLDEHVRRLEETKSALGDETIARIDAFGDALESAGIKAKNAFLEAFGAILKVADAAGRAADAMGAPAGYDLAKVGYTPQQVEAMNRAKSQREWLEKSKAMGLAVEAKYLSTYGEPFGPPMPGKGDARGSNADLLKAEKNPVEDYLRRQREQSRLLATPQPERAALQAEFEIRAAASERGNRLTREQIDLARELARSNYEAQNPNPVNEYIRSLEEEADVLGRAADRQAGLKAFYELSNRVRKDGIVISEQEKRKIIELADANEELKKRQEEAARFAGELHDKLSSALTDIAFDFKSASDAARRFAESIAMTILERKVTGPLADSLIGSGGNKGLLDDAMSGIGSLLGFADGGNPPVGVPSVVGERGREIIVPRAPMTVIPNHALGGTSVVVHQTFNMQPGLAETVGAAMRQAAPGIAAAAQAGVMQTLRKGGSESRIAGLRT